MSLDGDQPIPEVPLGPVPTACMVGVMQGKVLLQMHTPMGVAVYFLEAEAARTIGQGLAEAAAKAGTGIIVPFPEIPNDLRGDGS